MTTDHAIRLFADFLNKSWDTVQPLLLNRLYTTNDSSKDDWLQANWEILVERKILPVNEYLEPYGNGADFYSMYSRITDIKSNPTHKINIAVVNRIDILNNIKIENCEYSFNRLVGFENGFYTDRAPFNFILIEDEKLGIERVFTLEDVKFKISPV